MRLCLVFLLILSLSSVSQGQGFLDNFVSIFNRINPFRAQQSSRPSPPSSSAPVFRPRPASVTQPPVREVQPPQPFQPSLPQRPSVLPASLSQLRIVPIATPGRGNHNFEGRRYLLTWREGRTDFSWEEARNFCARNNMRIVSLDTDVKREHFLSLTSAHGLEFFWTGGRLSADKSSVSWESGAVESIARGQHPWSPAGLRGAQPDGGEGTENCLAVLNNVYNVRKYFITIILIMILFQDGVKFHDVGCHHRKATVCES